MPFTISPFDTSYLPQLDNLPPEEWQTDAYLLFLHNEWQPWFFPYMATYDGHLAGFGMYMLFGEFAWFGWILVHNNYRKKGLGTAMTEHLLDEATKRGAKGFILTATEMGKPIYEKFGFKTQSSYRFFKLPEIFAPQFERSNIRRATRVDFNRICELDLQATGEKRENLLENRLSECVLYFDEQVEGFYLPSFGNGYIVAENEKAGLNLLNLRCMYNKKVIVVPEQNDTAVTFMLKNKLQEGYSIPRMTLGKIPDWNPAMIYNRASGYCG